MQEIKKTRIVIASVLKPVDDTRMYEKMGLSLASTGEADVNIIGYPSTNVPQRPDVQFHPLGEFSRLSISRITAAWAIALKLIKLKPHVIIVCTHELLLGALLTKFIRGSRVIYDVRENYLRNIAYTNTFPLLFRWPVALHVRFKEIVAGLFIDHFILAERAYEIELNFPGVKKTVIENKLKKPSGLVQLTNRKVTGLKLLFSGTLAETTGVFEAIKLSSALHNADSSVQLTIIGFAAKEDVRVKIREAIKDKSFIKTIGIDTLVPHQQIINAIQQADVGIIAYPPNRSTENSIPTKLYEYLGATLPIIVPDHKPWIELCDLWSAAVIFPPADFDEPEFLRTLQQKTFYTKVPQNVFWEDGERQFTTLILG
jgi:hypothetical protein